MKTLSDVKPSHNAPTSQDVVRKLFAAAAREERENKALSPECISAIGPRLPVGELIKLYTSLFHLGSIIPNKGCW